MGEFFFLWRIIYGGVKSVRKIRELIKLITAKKEVLLNLEDKILDGNVLDVSMNNQGIIYNLCKKNSVEEVKTEYIRNNNKGSETIEDTYDNLALFFTLENLDFNLQKAKLIREMTGYLKEGGYINIWDSEKARWKYMNLVINILLPGNVKKIINIRSLNIFKYSSGKRISSLLEKDFDVIEFYSKDNIYYIRGKKKGSTIDEGSTGSS
jgi:hypothetical protein